MSNCLMEEPTSSAYMTLLVDLYALPKSKSNACTTKTAKMSINLNVILGPKRIIQHESSQNPKIRFQNTPWT